MKHCYFWISFYLVPQFCVTSSPIASSTLTSTSILGLRQGTRLRETGNSHHNHEAGNEGLSSGRDAISIEDQVIRDKGKSERILNSNQTEGTEVYFGSFSSHATVTESVETQHQQGNGTWISFNATDKAQAKRSPLELTQGPPDIEDRVISDNEQASFEKVEQEEGPKTQSRIKSRPKTHRRHDHSRAARHNFRSRKASSRPQELSQRTAFESMLKNSVLGNDRFVDLERNSRLVGEHFLIEEDSGGPSILKFSLANPQDLTQCIYRAKLESDPNSRVSLTGCSADSLDALVVSRQFGTHQVDPLTGQRIAFQGAMMQFGSLKTHSHSFKMKNDEVSPPGQYFFGKPNTTMKWDEATSDEDEFSFNNKMRGYRTAIGGANDLVLNDLSPVNLGLDKILLFLSPRPLPETKKVLFGIALKRGHSKGVRRMFSLVKRTQNLGSAYRAVKKAYRDSKRHDNTKKTPLSWRSKDKSSSLKTPLPDQKEETRTIELQLFTDMAFYEQMKAEHPSLTQGQDLNTKIVEDLLVIVDGTEALLQHPSLGVSFNIRLTKVRILSGNGPSPKGEILLDLLAEFQKYLEGSHISGTTSDHDPLYADINIMLTGRDYQSNAGYAYTNTMCTFSEYCVAVLKYFWTKDHEGTKQGTLRRAMSNLMAHEIAHTLGVSHDGEDNECSSDPTTNHIMTPIVATTAEIWSKCTRDSVLKFVRENNDFCLFQ
ncbi:uncharacterized protein LOC131880112 isoform X2 [Tigriopus californicus]|uniref:uncharacterized protein LOC131880112 isoform X2 n=1 Tax=Tigriopus californicus TaxID=6832 RepID=UPI0027DA1E7D|nr:uncharacterized protein LOC131880112 isoform X2 [Tigriopus californicus]